MVSLVNTTRDTWETTEYYPFGMPFVDGNGSDRYKFSMKEYDATSGLNLYDFEALMYDPALTRFMSPDPLADHYPSVSPYAYCANNPLRFTDLSGLRIFDIDQNGYILKITEDTPTDIIRILRDASNDDITLRDENKSELSISFPKGTIINAKTIDYNVQ